MFMNCSVAVVVPAYNEELLIGRVIETMPDCVDRIVVVNDCSRDRTGEIVQGYAERLGERVLLISHEKNQGVGGAIATGYKWARDNDMDIAVVMAGDAQMNPDDLHRLLRPVALGMTDYAKGNRLFTEKAWDIIPKKRYIGNSVLSLLTKIASGYWHVADSQSGYTAINKQALKVIDWDCMYKRYGQPNDLLVRLNVQEFRVVDVPVAPVYNIGERSGIKISKIIFTLSFLLLKLFFWRLLHKYFIRDFHPLIFFYILGMMLLALSVPLGARLLYYYFFRDITPGLNAIAFLFSSTTGFQSLFFAMWFDMFSNLHLKGKLDGECH